MGLTSLLCNELRRLLSEYTLHIQNHLGFHKLYYLYILQVMRFLFIMRLRNSASSYPRCSKIMIPGDLNSIARAAGTRSIFGFRSVPSCRTGRAHASRPRPSGQRATEALFPPVGYIIDGWKVGMPAVYRPAMCSRSCSENKSVRRTTGLETWLGT